MISPEQLDLIEARADAATEGPWAEDHEGETAVTFRCYKIKQKDYPLMVIATDPDAEFIGYAREDVPLLIAEVRRLQAENEILVNELKLQSD